MPSTAVMKQGCELWGHMQATVSTRPSSLPHEASDTCRASHQEANHTPGNADEYMDGFLPLVRRRTFASGDAKSLNYARTSSAPDFAHEANTGRPPLHGHLSAAALQQHQQQQNSNSNKVLAAAIDSAVAAGPAHRSTAQMLPGASRSQNSVSPGSHTTAKDLSLMTLHRHSMLEDLVTSVVHLMERHIYGPNKARGAGRGLQEEARRTVRAHFAALPSRYSLSVEAADVLVHVKLMAAARKTRTLQAHLSRGARAPAATAAAAARAVVVVACPDRADLLDAVTRALRRVSRRICDADVMTSDDGIALDRFEVELLPEAAALGDAAVIARVQAALAAQDAQPGGSSGGGRAQHDKDAPHVSWQLGSSGGGDGGARTLSLREGADGATICEWDGGGGGSSPGDSDASSVLDMASSPSSSPPPPEDAAAAAAAPPRTIPFEELELLETVGHGRFSLMRRALWRRRGGSCGGGSGSMVVAVKCVEPPSGADSERERALILGEFARELDIVQRLRHPHVCAFYGDAHAPAPSPQHCLVFEYVEGGNLADYLRRQSARAAAVDGAQVLRLAGQIAEGMRYLHACGILHRDLKTANILIDAQGDVRIVDFGLSCFNHPGADLTAETGTYRYMAPEVIRHEPYSAAADVYSYGIVLWELLARAQPFEGLTPIQAAFAVARKGLRPTLPPATPPPLAQLVRACWAADPALRPSFALVCDAAVPALRAALLGE